MLLGLEKTVSINGILQPGKAYTVNANVPLALTLPISSATCESSISNEWSRTSSTVVEGQKNGGNQNPNINL